jgi:hypothetical protein
MSAIDADTRRLWRQDPSETVSILVRVTGDVLERSASLEKIGLDIKRRYRLTATVSGTCTARVALKIASLSWVTAVEADRRIRIFGR